MKLSPIWQHNLKFLRDLRDSNLDDLGKLHQLQATELFSINSFNREIQHSSASRWIDHLKDHRLLSLGESREYNDGARFNYNAYRLSLDFLKKVNTAVLAEPYCGPGATVLEVGGGFGQLARIMLLGGLCKRYILVDLPETLYFARIFLEREVGGADIAFIPASDWDGLPDNDCFINTSSLGEMRFEVAQKYVRVLQQCSQSCVLLNRMLNTYHPIKEHFREHDNGWYWALDNYWETDRVELEPIFTRFTAEAMQHHRELLFCARRSESEHQVGISRSYGGTSSRSASCREVNQFLHDATESRIFLEAVRTMPTVNHLDALIRYLYAIQLKWPFEDMPYLLRRYRDLAGEPHEFEPGPMTQSIRMILGPMALKAYQMIHKP